MTGPTAARAEFIERLHLAPDADERQVRRAYARELKLIDQERDIEGFQHLRACYEAALAWVAWRGGDGSGAPAVVAPPAGEGDATPWQADGHAAFAALRERTAELATWRERASASDAIRNAPWIGALHEALGDPRLVNLEARFTFEHDIAALLAAGWQPGHQALLDAAARVFGWDEDQHALARLGAPGALLEEALVEQAILMGQETLVRTRLRSVLWQLRQPALPGYRAMRRQVGVLLALAMHFPTLLHVVAPRHAVQTWRARFPDAVATPLWATAQGDVARPWKEEFGWPYLFVFLAVVGLGHWMPGRERAPAHGAASHEEAQPPALRQEEGPPAEVLAAMNQHFSYVPGKDHASGHESAKVEVTIDGGGMPTRLDVLIPPSDPAFVEAIRKAVAAVAPFPATTPARFRFDVRWNAPPAPFSQ